MDHKKESVLKFFQQSGWVAVATAVSTGLNGAVNLFAHKLGKDHYGTYCALLASWQLLASLSLGFQAVFMRYAASAEVLDRPDVLAGAVQSVVRLNLVLWTLFGAVFFVFREQASSYLKVSGMAAWWITVLVLPSSALLSIFNGVLQGKQKFAWFGGLAIVSGLSRLVFVALCIYLVGATANSAAFGVLLAFIVTLLATAWATRDSWLRHGSRFHWLPFLSKAFFLTAGLGSGSVLMSLDNIEVKHFFTDHETGLYSAAGVIGRVLIPLSGALLTVMFPKIVKSKLLDQKTHALKITLGLTVLAAGSATVFLYFFPDLPIRLLQGPDYLAAAPLVPWYCLCQIPLTVAVVLLYNLLGRERYAAVPFLALVAIGYHAGLNHFHSSMKEFIWVMGAAGLAFLAVTAFFTWGWGEKSSSPGEPAAAQAPKTA